MYTSFILPHFDCADVIWDNFVTRLSDELEYLHLTAIRTITGTVHGTSRPSLYKEYGFLTHPSYYVP